MRSVVTNALWNKQNECIKHITKDSYADGNDIIKNTGSVL